MNENSNDVSLAGFAETEIASADGIAIPEYLSRHYWWAYIHPWAVAFWDHLWIVNLILLGNYKRLRDRALAEFGPAQAGRVLQVACVYGDISVRLARSVGEGRGALDVVDVLPIQLRNLERKLPPDASVRLLRRNSADLALPSESYDWVMLFFLLHEQPEDVRQETLREAFRVVKPDGKVLIVDFAKPRWWNPFRYLWRVFLYIFEPFALAMWWNDIRDMLPPSRKNADLRRESFFGGLFQKVVVSPAANDDGASKGN